ncbi:MAG: hypothetical protein LBC77_03995 [Spirochaetaceae bacterium]|jgi:diacylglycerol kinase family enzyme|nr:hypothetical protein [Spirochaetaceae bacterium]
MKHFVVLNPRHLYSKSNIERAYSYIETAFKALGDVDYELYTSRFPRDAVGAIKEYCGGGEKTRVYAAGGDGILFDCLNGVAGCENVELTAIPYGGGANDFLRDFGDDAVPMFRDLKLLYDAVPVPVDIFSCNANYAINYCGIGIEGDASLFTEFIMNLTKKRVALLKNYLRYTYGLGAFFAFFKKNICEKQYRIIIDGSDYSGIYAGVFIANGSCFGCNKISSLRAMVDDGVLNVILAKSADLFTLMRCWPAFQNGSPEKHPDIFTEVRAKKISIWPEDDCLEICLDGEPMRDSFLEIKVIPRGIQFAIPQKLAAIERGIL